MGCLSTNSFSDTQKTGDLLQIVVPAVGLATAFYLDDEEGQLQFYKSFGTNWLITHALKNTVKKERPDGSNDQSFPSGHTSAAFQGAAFIHKRYGWNYGIAAYAAASYVGYSRVDSDKHDNADVLAGALIGTLSSFYFTTEYKNISVTPIAWQQGYQINISMKW
jgi:membrane-associated phospholipid phosphatase